MEENSNIMIQNVMKLKKSKKYAEFAQEHLDDYRTRNGFVEEQLKLLGITKGELARRLGTSNQILNRWERNGFPNMEKAFEMALALELGIEEVNDFLQKYAGFRDMSSAYEEHFCYIYVLIYYEELKIGMPRREDETIAAWVKRIWKDSEAFASESKIEIRSSGAYTLDFLEQYVKGSRFEKNSGNRAAYQNDVWKFDMIFREDKKRYQWICKQLGSGQIPDKEELIELGLMLRMKRKQIDELLRESGHYPLSAKNIYEGALIMVLTNLEYLYPNQFELYKELSKPLALRMVVVDQVGKCLEGLSNICKEQLKEVPKWFAPEREAFFREKQRCAIIILDMEKHILNTWVLFHENRDMPLKIDCLLKEHVEASLENIGCTSLDVEKDQELILEIQKIESQWLTYMKSPGVLDISKMEFREAYKGWFKNIETYYLKKYAPKMKEKGETDGI